MVEFARNLAFVVGINNYGNGIHALRTAVNDASKLAEILREQHGYEVSLHLNESATLKNLLRLLEETLLQQVTPDDRLLFYFAGHGIALNGDDGPQGYLIPQDAVLGDTQSFLTMSYLGESLEKLPCRHFLGIFDCCFAGAFRWSNTRSLLPVPGAIYKERYDRFTADPAWQAITSASYDQKTLDAFSISDSRGQIGNHSLFATALFEALEGAADAYPPAKEGKPAGDGVITATELYLYLRDRLENETSRQTPGIWALRKHDKGEYIFLTPGHSLNLPSAPPLDESRNPYRGLMPYEEEDHELFFGRDASVKQLQQIVKNQPLTIVLGSSGVGKSSLVKAGLIPLLRQQTSEQWDILQPICPGDSPLQALSAPFTSSPNLQGSDLNDIINALVRDRPSANLLITIDQFEELFTLCRVSKREEFLQMLSRAIAQNPNQLRIVVTLRSDFEPQLKDTALGRYWAAGRFLVPPMTRAELREAIEKPAQAQVIFFEPHSLVDQIIDEVAGMPGALPLMSFALSELYLKYLRRQREGMITGNIIERSITQRDYEELGGVLGALTQVVEHEYQELLRQDPAYEQVIRHVMLRMVAIESGETSRRKVPLSELEFPESKNNQVQQVIQNLTSARLLVIGQNAEGVPYVEPAHDTLILGWPRLLQWIQARQENLISQRRLTVAVEDWIKNNRSEAWLWDKNPYLNILKQVLNSDDNWLNLLETEFVQRSIRKQEGIIGGVKNLWERFTRGNYQPEESSVVSETQQKINIPNPEIEIANDDATTNTDEQSESNTLNAQRKIYALLVGIDNYQSSSVSPLQGCVNDVEDVENYLNKRVTDGYQLHLRKLINEEATRQAVIDAFQQHLCQAESDDVAIFYFAGHGSQEKSPSEFQLPQQFKGLINTLVCWDSRLEGSLDINGFELAYLMMKVSYKNPNFIIILDIVHADFDAKALMQSIITRKADKDFSSYRIINKEEITLETIEHLGNHILLTACRDVETAKEYALEGKKQGAFTYFLFKTLRQYNSKLTYQDLMKGVSALVRAKVKDQSPQIRAMYADDLKQPFLGGAVSQSIPYFIVSYHKEYGWVIDGGAIHGVRVATGNETTSLALFTFDSDATDIINPSLSIGKAKVVEVLSSLSKIEISGVENLSTETLFKAVITSQPNPPLGVYIEGDSVGVSLARQALHSSGFGRRASINIYEVIEPKGIADLRLLCRDGEYLVTSATNEKPVLAKITGYTEDDAAHLIHLLEHIARWTSINKLSAPATSGIKPDDIKMEIITYGQEEMALSMSHLHLEYEEDENGELVPPSLHIRLSNNSTDVLFCNVLALNNRFSVSVPFFNTRNCLRLEPGSIVEGEYINTTVPDELWEEGVTESQDIFKLIVSTEDFDVSLLEQETLNTYGYSS